MTRLNQFGMYEEQEDSIVLNENSVDRKPCINRESKSDELTILVIQLSLYQHEVNRSCNTTFYLSHKKVV